MDVMMDVVMDEHNRAPPFFPGETTIGENGRLIMQEQEISAIKCNMCGERFTLWDRQQGFHIGAADKRLGYGSEHDGEKLVCNLCCDCFDKLMGMLRFTIDPFQEVD